MTRRTACLAVRLGWFIGIFTLAPSTTLAQSRSVVERPVVPSAGEEIRVVQRGERGAVHGHFVDATESEIVLTSIPGGGPIRIPMADVTGVSVHRGYHTQALAGALVGAGLGVVAGVVMARSGDVFDDTATSVGVSAGVGLPLGLLVGWLIRAPDWDGVDLAGLAR